MREVSEVEGANIGEGVLRYPTRAGCSPPSREGPLEALVASTLMPQGLLLVVPCVLAWYYSLSIQAGRGAKDLVLGEHFVTRAKTLQRNIDEDFAELARLNMH
jgi:hypothetical protein